MTIPSQACINLQEGVTTREISYITRYCDGNTETLNYIVRYPSRGEK